jgi:hypothetical protein
LFKIPRIVIRQRFNGSHNGNVFGLVRESIPLAAGEQARILLIAPQGYKGNPERGKPNPETPSTILRRWARSPHLYSIDKSCHMFLRAPE